MKDIILNYRGEQINASVNPVTFEVVFDGNPVTGKMWMISPGEQFVEIFAIDGAYVLEPAP